MSPQMSMTGAKEPLGAAEHHARSVMDHKCRSGSSAAPCPRCPSTIEGVSQCDTPSIGLRRSPTEQAVRGGQMAACVGALPHHARGTMHVGIAVVRSTGGRACVIGGQGSRGRPRDLPDSGVHRDMCGDVRPGPRGRVHRSPSGWTHRSGSQHAFGVGVRVCDGNRARVRGRRGHAAHLQNPTWGVPGAQPSGCIGTTGEQRSTEKGRGSGHSQLGGCIHHVFCLSLQRPGSGSLQAPSQRVMS